jgi:hypothetical protein
MPTDLTLAEFAERAAPREFRVWRAMRSILSDSTKISPKRAARLERATARLIDKHRSEYLKRYRIDEGTFLSSLRSATPNSLPVILTFFDTPTERENEIMWRVSHDACNEALYPLFERYRRQCAQAEPTLPIYTSVRRKRTLFDRLIAKLLAAMVRPGVTVTATHDGVNRRALNRVELQKAKIDLANDALSIAGHTWSLVQIEMPDAVAQITPPGAEESARRGGRKTTTRDNMVSWLSEHHPNGVPGHLKNSAILDAMRKVNILGSDKTLRRALRQYRGQVPKTA